MSDQPQKDNEALPCNSAVEVFRNNRVYKTAKWWMEAVGATIFGRRKLFVYLWIKDAGRWKRKGKLTVGSKRNWEDIKQAVEGSGDGYEKSLLDEVFG